MEQRLADMRDDPALHLSVDANAVAGLLAEVFGRDVTAMEERCRHCGTVSPVGALRVYLRGPGVVVRCPACIDVVLRIARTPSGLQVDLVGATNLSLE